MLFWKLFFVVDILILMHILIKAIVFHFFQYYHPLLDFKKKKKKKKKKVKAQLETIPTNSRV